VFATGQAWGCTAIQIATKNMRRWRAAPLAPATCAEFARRWRESTVRAVVAHASYLINLAHRDQRQLLFGDSEDQSLYRRSIEALIREIQRADALGILWVVLHAGSHRGTGVDNGIRAARKALEEVLARTADCRTGVAVETTAGQGTAIGHTLEQTAHLTEGHPRLGCCLDSCHLFAAGYDMRPPADYERLVERIAATIGLSRITVVHLNDSRTDLGSRIDRHETVGEGRIGLEPFAWWVRDSRFAHAPKIVECPDRDRTSPQAVAALWRLLES